ncbi:MAG: thiamine pyrophosphate-dependent dehydrogenase E1 component subunit alpha [Verrucomicrobiales bacterium]
MSNTISSLKSAGPKPGASFRERYKSAYRWMVLARVLEEKIGGLYRSGGKIVGGVYLGRGQEAFSAALGQSLSEPGDVFGPLIRDMAGRLAFGEPLLDAPRTYLGSASGPMRGRDGNIHRGRPREGLPAMISHLGALASVVAGMLLAKRMRGEQGIAGGTCIGDGATSTGSFHEAINLAAVEKLPLIFAVANNHYAYSTPNAQQFACENLVDRAIGYGVRGYRVDGTDLAQCLDAFTEAAARARAGEGPQMVVGDLLRLSGHGEHDDARYVDPKLRESKVGRDCLAVARQYIADEGWMAEAELDAWRGEAEAKVDEAIATAQREAPPDPFKETWHALATKHLMDTYISES